jgi:AcrR family transcriptional regulator
MADLNFSTDLLEEVGANRSERRDAVENRARVLAAARLLFDQVGVEGVTMAAIAEEARVGKGTLYRRFRDKGAICLELLHDQLVLHQAEMLAMLREMEGAGVPYLTRLQRFLAEVAHFTDSHVPLLREVQRGGKFAGAEGDRPFFQWQRMTVQGLLQAAARSGELAPALDPVLTADLLIAPLTATFYRYLRQERGVDADELGAALAAMVERFGQVRWDD